MPLVCTIHQPSSVLFEYFDRLLLLARGGKTVYFGEIGEKSQTLTGYFAKHGVRKCEEEENPAEYILEAIGAGTSGKVTEDWPQIWNDSEEKREVSLNGHENVKLTLCTGRGGVDQAIFTGAEGGERRQRVCDSLVVPDHTSLPSPEHCILATT